MTSIVLGVVFLVAQIVVSHRVHRRAEGVARELDDEYDADVAASQEYGATMGTCAGGAKAHAAPRPTPSSRSRCGTSPPASRRWSLPSGALDEAEELHDQALTIADLLEPMGAATSDPDGYAALTGDCRTAASRLDEDYLELREAMRFGG